MHNPVATPPPHDNDPDFQIETLRAYAKELKQRSWKYDQNNPASEHCQFSTDEWRMLHLAQWMAERFLDLDRLLQRGHVQVQQWTHEINNTTASDKPV